jgi:Ca2+-transporting ATPase
MIYSGTSAVYGRAKAIVVNTGMSTEFGKIANLLESTENKRTPLQNDLDKLGQQLGIFSIVLAALVSSFELLRGTPLSGVFVWGVALAVAIIPEALPAVVTITLALGVKRMVKRKALIRKLPAVETLGATNIICSDKTGTLTQDEMTIRKIFTGDKIFDVTGSGYKPSGKFIYDNKEINPNNYPELIWLLESGSLCNDASLRHADEGWDIFGDPTEGSIIVTAKKAGINVEEIQSTYKRIFEIPFSSESKRMTTIHKIKARTTAISKGAPEVIIESCDLVLIDGKFIPLTIEIKKKIYDMARSFGETALRILAVAGTDVKEDIELNNFNENLVFYGLVGMIDPPRLEAKEAIIICEKAGIKPVMITGDNKITAVAVAKELGIMKNGFALSGIELERLSDEEFENIVDKTDVFARISPSHKLKIVEGLMKKGNIVAMTGDGVNDAPSLKRADIGVAMGITGTDVSKEASDMILTDDNFASIVSAVEEGRSIFENIRKYLVFLLSGNMGTVFALIIAIMAWLPQPLLAVHILFINFIMDGIMAITLGLEPPEKGIMNRLPRKVSEGILNKNAVYYISIMGIYIAFATIFVYYHFGGAVSDPMNSKITEYGLTMFYASLIMARLFNAVSCRSLRASFFTYYLKGNIVLVLGIIVTLILTLITIYLPYMNVIFHTVPLGFKEWLIITLCGISVVLFSEIFKFAFKKITQ